MSKSIHFFETQFQKQVANSALDLNPFETKVLPYLKGRVLDFGCGLGNLSIAMARQGCSVLALDAAPTAIRHLAALATREQLSITAREADLRNYVIDEDFDSVVSIGLLAFFDCATALRQLSQLQTRVRPGGIAAINVLIEGTTYLDMYDPAAHYPFRRHELTESFSGWDLLDESFDNFPAPGDTIKAFATVTARKPEK